MSDSTKSLKHYELWSIHILHTYRQHVEHDKTFCVKKIYVDPLQKVICTGLLIHDYFMKISSHKVHINTD